MKSCLYLELERGRGHTPQQRPSKAEKDNEEVVVQKRTKKSRVGEVSSTLRPARQRANGDSEGESKHMDYVTRIFRAQ
jgi:hypothetical protein